MFYLFDFAKVVIFLPFTKYFCNYFCFRHYFFLFTLLYRRTAAPLRHRREDRAEQHHNSRPPRHRPGIHSSHRRTPNTRTDHRPPHTTEQGGHQRGGRSTTTPTADPSSQGERWARPRPVWYASCPEPCALGAQPDALARLGCARA